MLRSAVGLLVFAVGAPLAISGCGSSEDGGTEPLPTGGRAFVTGGVGAGRGGASGTSGAVSKGGTLGTGGSGQGASGKGGAFGSGGSGKGGSGSVLSGAGGKSQGGVGGADCSGPPPVQGKACEGAARVCPSKSGEQCLCIALKGDDPTWNCLDLGQGGNSGAGGFSFGGFSFGGFSFAGFRGKG